MASALKAVESALQAIQAIGLGFDLAVDLRLKYCKGLDNPSESKLIVIEQDTYDQDREFVIPGGIRIPRVPKSIKCDKGDRIRFNSDVLSFQQMSEQFNQEVGLSGKIPSGYFNASFDFTNCWQKDAAYTKTLAFDGVCITLYSIALDKAQFTLCDHVKDAYGTHVIVGVKMGGKDMIYVKQQYSSPLQPTEVQKKLKEIADKRFTDATGNHGLRPEKAHEREKVFSTYFICSCVQLYVITKVIIRGLLLGYEFEIRDQSFPLDMGTSDIGSQKEDIIFFCKRRGGRTARSTLHSEWCHTVQFEPDVISMSFVPITSLLGGVNGSGFLSHAINLYLRYKPQIEELNQFLEFQVPRQWAPVYGELSLGPQGKPTGASLQFSFMGPKLYINTTQVDVGKRPVTGLRLYLEGKRSNCLAIHLQHLSSLPDSFKLQDELKSNMSRESDERRYFEKVQWKNFSHVCTAPVESDEDTSIVTGAYFEVKESSMKSVLFLRLKFSKVIGATTVKTPEWDGSPGMVQKSGIISSISTRFATAEKPSPKPSDVNVNSALYPDGPPVPAQSQKLLRFVDTTEMARGPQDPPGYWVVSGARLIVEKGRISLRVKYSLLTAIAPDEDVP
ncbi:Membrane attack complex component/perforin (MACPF) domain [Dillenia turbinata]|uniref:Membrane attack complex component/perforin (MACPF) domain n=1 Tax=Dillenia turbinata TaxID=194707 RepID=A0AAN8V4Y9_9MAGN